MHQFQKEWIEPTTTQPTPTLPTFPPIPEEDDRLVIMNLDFSSFQQANQSSPCPSVASSTVSSKKRRHEDSAYSSECSSGYSTEEEDPYEPVPLFSVVQQQERSSLEFDKAFQETIANFNFAYESKEPKRMTQKSTRSKRSKRSRSSGKKKKISVVGRLNEAQELVAVNACASESKIDTTTTATAEKDTNDSSSVVETTASPAFLAMNNRFEELLQKSTASQKALEEWDRKNGLPRSHCQTMVNSSRSRKQLQSGLILPKWNGKPLLNIPGAKTVGLYGCRQLFNQDSPKR
mmetsp:Transcript_13678/g.23297  ORF Transcript_13678/g.23297 Transcript_13678/m.23297 type:complete len:291 (-) Transcript_13678:544-1416(-)